MDWEVRSFGDLCVKIQDGTHFSPTLGGSAFLYVTSRNIEFGRLDVSNAERISEEEHRKIYARCDTRLGDLLITKDGANTGNAAINTLEEECSLLSSVAFLRFDSRAHDTRFYLQCILSGVGQQQIKGMMSGNAITRLTLAKIRQLRVPSPPEPEQRAIAQALSDVDGLLGALDALVAKKRAMKQAAMQQLLTGKTRLPGFSGPWEVRSLDVLVACSTGVWGKGGPDERNCVRAEIIRAGDISQEGHLTATATRFLSPGEYAKAKCDLDTLVITTSGNGLGKLWWCDGRKDIAASNFVRVLRPDATRVVGRFLFYALRTEEGLRQLLEHTATSAYPNLRPTYFSSTWIPVPGLAEQTAIATVLTDIDAEIAALERQATKTRAIKQGMMQQLLTGRIRLVKLQQAKASA